MSNHIFHDPKGRRAPWINGIAIALAFLTSGLMGIFALTLVVKESAEPKKSASQVARFLTNFERRNADEQLARLKSELRQSLSQSKTKTNENREDHVILAYFAPWDDSALSSFQAHAEALTHVAPVWLTMNDQGTEIDFSEFDPVQDLNQKRLLEISRKFGIKIIPVLSNAKDSKFDPKRVRPILADPEKQSKLITELIRWCLRNSFQGIQFDFEELVASDAQSFSEFLVKAGSEFHKSKLEISIAVQPDTPSKTLANWADSVDYEVLMAYDEHEESSSPGPIASLDWVDRVLEAALKDVPENKLVLGIASYGYDWTKNQSHGTSVTFQEAMSIASGLIESSIQPNPIHFDPEKMNSTFEYRDENQATHTVWLLDAPSIANIWKIGQQRRVRGAALWALGTEDPSLWTFFSASQISKPISWQSLSSFEFPFQVAYEGKGEILQVMSLPKSGKRIVTVDAKSGFIDDVVYEEYATPYVVKKEGYKSNKIILTFDDGPDPTWTPQILDKLKKFNVLATFFCVGNNIESYPYLVQRAYQEGHEIGNHSFLHPDLGSVTEQRAKLEIVATQRIIEATLDRSTTIFRPPFNADSQPTSSVEMRPVELAEKLKLTTVGENVDPTDWNLSQPDGRKRTAQDLSDFVLKDLERRKKTGEEGNIILLHDAGGDRSETVKALDILIPALKAKGYEFTTVSGLMGWPRDRVMPPISHEGNQLLLADKTVFSIAHWAQIVLNAGFVLAIILGLGRIFFVVPLALWQSRKVLPLTPTDSKIAVLIAAYNEEKTIEKTIASVLKSQHPISEVLVIDDGSQDNTFAKVASGFAKNDRVRVIRKENGGKASALNLGIKQSQAEMLLCLDADTVLDSNAVGYLAQHLQDPRVGAVAGSVEVGNICNILTAWQSVEYRTSQNIDRRAYSILNAVTVVPGAIGMWRKSVLEEVGGFSTDTLAEDMDLTWLVREAGYKIETDSRARAYTEAPETWNALSKQRFRWAFGTFQCMWKHRKSTFRHGWFGWFALPGLWLFQVVFQLLGPFVDAQILFSASLVLLANLQPHSAEVSNAATQQSLNTMLLLYSLFFAVELTAGLIAYRLDRAKPWPLVWLFLQRFAYRQLMYVVMLKSIWYAIIGRKQGWKKLARTGRVGDVP